MDFQTLLEPMLMRKENLKDENLLRNSPPILPAFIACAMALSVRGIILLFPPDVPELGKKKQRNSLNS